MVLAYMAQGEILRVVFSLSFHGDQLKILVILNKNEPRPCSILRVLTLKGTRF